jgi:Collagen triple helix repeat (20 copies)
MHQRLQRLHSHIGTAGLIVAIVALVAALGGGAYAATGNSGDSQATASAKGKQGPRGKTGKTGKTGAPGAAGPQGAKGDPGAAGAPGANGAAGAAGAGVQLSAATDCEEGGTKVTVGSTSQEICNGEEGGTGAAGADGATGPAGPPGPTCSATGECLLPAGATQTGVWRFQKLDALGTYVITISFPLRLSSAANFVRVPPASSTTPGAVTGCPGTAAQPKADSGNFCFYEAENFNVEESFPEAAADPTSGLYVTFSTPTPAEPVSGNGTWAVKR